MVYPDNSMHVHVLSQGHHKVRLRPVSGAGALGISSQLGHASDLVLPWLPCRKLPHLNPRIVLS